MANPGNRTCQLCQLQEATYFCTCHDPPPLFCIDCFPHHHNKYPNSIHSTIPIAALGRNPGDYLAKCEALKKGEAELRRNLLQMDQFIQEFEDLIQRCINYLTKYRNWRLQNLQTEKDQLSTSIEAAVQETRDCLNQGTQPRSMLAQALWFLPHEQLSVVSYSVTIPNLETLCGTWSSYKMDWQSLVQSLSRVRVQSPEVVKQSVVANRPQEIPETEFPISVYTYITRNKVATYNLSSGQSSESTISIDFGSGGSYIQVDSQTLLCIGASPATTGVYELNLVSFEVTSMPSIRVPRDGAGVAKSGYIVYVFGGEGAHSPTHLKSCEKYALLDKNWLTLGDMHEARCGFTPCNFRSLIYLLCPYSTRSIETFSPQTEIFTVLPVSLPTQMVRAGSVSFVVNGEIYILTNEKQMGRWRVESDREFQLFPIDRGCCSTQPPLIMDSLVLIGNNYHEIERVELFDTATYTFISL